MKTFGKKTACARLEKMQDSPQWRDRHFANVHPITPGLRGASAPRPTLSEFICGGVRVLTDPAWGARASPTTLAGPKRIQPVRVTAAPSQHFSGRGLKDRNATLWSSLAIRSPRHAVFFSGDTGLTDDYATIRERLGPFDLTLLEVGACHSSWGNIHLGPDNAMRAHALLGGGVFLPVHWGTFRLAPHAWDDPVVHLYAQRESVAGRLTVA